MRNALLSALMLAAATVPSARLDALNMLDAVSGGDGAFRCAVMNYALQNDRVEVNYNRCSPGVALEQVQSGVADAAVIDAADLPENFEGVALTYAVEPVVFMVNAANPVDGLALEDVQSLFSPLRPADWGKFGAFYVGLVCYGPRRGTPGANRIQKLLPEAQYTAVEDIQQTVLLTSAQPGALSAGLFPEACPVTVKMLAVNGVKPTLTSVVDGSYPLSFGRVLIRGKADAAETADFLKFIAGAEFRELLYSFGQMPVDGSSPMADSSEDNLLSGKPTMFSGSPEKPASSIRQ